MGTDETDEPAPESVAEISERLDMSEEEVREGLHFLERSGLVEMVPEEERQLTDE